MKKRKITRTLFAACTAGLLSVAPVHAQSPHTHNHSFGDAQKWTRIVDDPKRDAWQNPHEVIQALKLKPDAVVDDIGSGTGYFSVRAAHMTPQGRVYGIDTEPDMVKYLAERTKRDGLKNVTAVQARHGGRLAIIDFRMESPEGPPKAARIAPEQVTLEMQRAGYVLTEEHGFLPNQYFLVFAPG